MSPGDSPRILVCAETSATLTDLRRQLAVGGHDVAGHLLGSADPAPLTDYKVILIDGAPGKPALELGRRLRSRLEDHFVPLLFLVEAGSPQAGFEAGADGCLRKPFPTGELLAWVHAFLRIKDSHDRLTEKTAEIHRINKRLQQAYQQIDLELQLAQRIQSSFLPHTLPQVPHVRFAVHNLLCGRVGGDFYDVFRLDERHVGFYVADAMGHGVPASLLTIFVKKGVRPKEVFGQQYRLIPPDEVLSRLNRALIDQQLSEQPFITMVYVLLDHLDGTLQFSRAGHPYPLYVPRNGPPRLWQQEGLLLGVVDATFPVQVHRLEPGDKVLLYSDGIDNATFEEQPTGLDSLLACANRHRKLPVQDFVGSLARDLFGARGQNDDLTLFGVELGEG
jgi:sigma-B regulation protein RsbU (phosphoserine phosphatase)